MNSLEKTPFYGGVKNTIRKFFSYQQDIYLQLKHYFFGGKMINKKLIYASLIFLICGASFSQVEYDLNEAKLEINENNWDVAIAYENYVMAKQESKAATLALLPSFSAEYLLLADSFLYDLEYLILRTVLPEPSRFFNASASKQLAEAARINKLVTTRNILADFEKTYFLNQMRKAFLPSLEKEVQIRAEIEKSLKEAYELGAVDFSEYYAAKKATISAISLHSTAEHFVKTDELSVKMILNIPTDTDLQLEYEEFYNGSLPFPKTANDAQNIAVNNSKEIESYGYSIRAAKKLKKGVSISWLSWGGVGFDSFAKVSIAKSNIRKLELQRSQAVVKTKNQVSKLYKLIENQLKKIEIQAYLLNLAKDDLETKVNDLNGLRGTKLSVNRALLTFMGTERELTKLEYELEILFIDLKRALGSTMISNQVPQA